MAALKVITFPAPERPADLIQLAQPRLNKCDWLEEYQKQLRNGEYDTIWARVTESKTLTCAEWNELMRGFLTDREWLAGKGGCGSWAFSVEDRRDWLQLSEPERQMYRNTAFSLVIEVVAPTGQKVYIDPQGYNYARYVAFPLAGIPMEKTREQTRREEQEREQARKKAELLERIANPPVVPDSHGLRFLWNGLKYNGGALFKASYSQGTLTSYPEGTITIYASDYRRFPAEVARYFHVENNTEIQSDYFDDDKVRVCPNHPLYSLVAEALKAQEDHHARRLAKRMERKGY